MFMEPKSPETAVDRGAADWRRLRKYEGCVEEGATGNIRYTFQLDRPYSGLKILLSYDADKEKPEHLSDSLIARTEAAYARHRREALCTEMLPELIREMKTEIQLAAFLNGEFLGNRHMPGVVKEMLLTENAPSPGCFGRKTYEGSLAVVVNFFQVLADGTHYRLEVFVPAEEGCGPAGTDTDTDYSPKNMDGRERK